MLWMKKGMKSGGKRDDYVMKTAIKFFAIGIIMTKMNGADIPQFIVSSEVFENGQAIPQEYSCDGTGYSPDIYWGHVEKWVKDKDIVKSVAFIVEDPDAPIAHPPFVHWLIFNMAPTTESLPKNAHQNVQEFGGKTAVVGKNSAGKNDWTPACPPSGSHRYYFKVYALDTMLSLTPSATRDDLLKAMQDHIVAQGELMGTYQKKQK
jgi:hypothetical protein